MALTPGVMFGAYEIRSLIGSGGMGEVYRAHDTALDRDVAIKVVAPNFIADPSATRRLLREARAAAALNHPNVCTIYEVGRIDEQAFIAMELIDGEPLGRLIPANGLSEEQTIRLGLQIVEAVAHAHDQTIVHRDLKPANILIRRDGRLKVLDFGLAKRLVSADAEDVSTHASLTQPGVAVGTLAYMAPELLCGHQADTRSDVWALGVLLFEMSDGRRPFAARTGFELMSSILNQPPRALARSLSVDFRTIVERCLEKEPDRRYRSAAGVRSALDRIQPRSVPFDGPRSSHLKWRRRWAVAAVGCAVLVVIAASGWRLSHGGWGAVAAGRPSALASRRVPTRRSVAVIGFRNISDLSSTRWISTALSEMLTTELAAGGDLRAVPGETVARVATDLALRDAGSFARDTLAQMRINLGADLIASGGYVVIGNEVRGQIRVDLRLQDSTNGETLSSMSETGTIADLFDLVVRLGVRTRQALAIPAGVPANAASVRASMPATPEAARAYAEGLSGLWRFDASGARQRFAAAIALEPSHALAHSALAAALAELGEDANAKAEAQRAFELSSSMPKRDRLWIEGRYRETSREWDRAASVYDELFKLDPDNIEYGIRLCETLISGNRSRDVFATTTRLRAIAPPIGNDPRIDVLDARAAEALSDFSKELSSAQTAIDKAIASGASLIVARARIAEAWALRNLGQFDKALGANEEAKRLYAAAGDKRGLSRALTQIGSTLRQQGRLPEAAKALSEALDLARGLGNSRTTAVALNGLANVMFNQGRYADAQPLYEESLFLNREVGDRLAIAQTLDNLASVHYEQGRVSAAARLDDEALALRRQIGDKRGVALSLLNMAETRTITGQLANAMNMFDESLRLSREIANKSIEASALVGLGTVLDAGAKLGDARKAHEQALALRLEAGDRSGTVDSRIALAEIALQDRRFGDAGTLVQEALDSLKTSARPEQLARAYLVRGHVMLARGDSASARTAVEQAASKVDAISSRDARLRIRIRLARLQARLQDWQLPPDTSHALVEEAARAGFQAIEFEARLAEAELLTHSHTSARARNNVHALQTAATARGFNQIAAEAAALLREGKNALPD